MANPSRQVAGNVHQIHVDFSLAGRDTWPYQKGIGMLPPENPGQAIDTANDIVG